MKILERRANGVPRTVELTAEEAALDNEFEGLLDQGHSIVGAVKVITDALPLETTDRLADLIAWWTKTGEAQS